MANPAFGGVEVYLLEFHIYNAVMNVYLLCGPKTLMCETIFCNATVSHLGGSLRKFDPTLRGGSASQQPFSSHQPFSRPGLPPSTRFIYFQPPFGQLDGDG
eukprot:EG_transcript_49112